MTHDEADRITINLVETISLASSGAVLKALGHAVPHEATLAAELLPRQIARINERLKELANIHENGYSPTSHDSTTTGEQ